MNAAPPLRRWRRITVWVLIVLAGVIGLVSALTVWAKRQALDTDKWVATSSRLLEDDEIRGLCRFTSSTSSTRTSMWLPSSGRRYPRP